MAFCFQLKRSILSLGLVLLMIPQFQALSTPPDENCARLFGYDRDPSRWFIRWVVPGIDLVYLEWIESLLPPRKRMPSEKLGSLLGKWTHQALALVDEKERIAAYVVYREKDQALLVRRLCVSPVFAQLGADLEMIYELKRIVGERKDLERIIFKISLKDKVLRELLERNGFTRLPPWSSVSVSQNNAMLPLVWEKGEIP